MKSLPLPKEKDLFFSTIIGLSSILSFFFLESLLENERELLNLISSFFLKEPLFINWPLIIVITPFSIVLGYFFLILGDFLLIFIFEGTLDLKKLLNEKNPTLERVFLHSAEPKLSLKTFLCTKESILTDKSEYYYELSKFFSGLYCSQVSVLLLAKLIHLTQQENLLTYY